MSGCARREMPDLQAFLGLDSPEKCNPVSPWSGPALTVGGYSALGATMGALFLGAAATLVRRPASQGGSLDRMEP
jgi:hypothetical protein